MTEKWEVGVRLGWLLMTRETFRMDKLESEVDGETCGNTLLTREVSKCLLAILAGGVISHHVAGQAYMRGVCAPGFVFLSECQFPTQSTRVSLCKPNVDLPPK